MATAPDLSDTTEESTCPICLDVFVVPRQLSCMHTFCQCCLQSYLNDHVSGKGGKTLVCPLCRTVIDIPRNERPVEEWALSFPINEVSQMTSPNSKVERLCNSCSYENISEPAVQFCVECKEGFCKTCLKFHRKLSATKSHKTVSINEISNNVETLLKLGNGFGCPKHASKEIEFFCRKHDIVCCATCLFNDHRDCKLVHDLQNSTESLLLDINTDEILRKLKAIEDSMKHFIAQKTINISNLSLIVNTLDGSVQTIRRKINNQLDEMEKVMKIEGKRLYKEGIIQHQDEIQQCQSLMSAVRNSHTFLEAVSRHGSDKQLLIASSKTKTHLALYVNNVRDIFNRAESISVNIEKILSHVTTICRTLPLVGIDVLLRGMKVGILKVVHVNLPVKTTFNITAIAHLSGDRIVLASWYKCLVLDPSYNVITSFSLSSYPWDVCVLDDDKVAVTMPNINTIGILSLNDGSILTNKLLKTAFTCWGVYFVSTERYVISGLVRNTICWSILMGEGIEESRQDICSSSSFSYITVNNIKTCVCVSVTDNHAVHYFSLVDSSQMFVYKSDNVRSPYGIALDRDGNVYIAGHNSDNVHKLSQEGRLLQIISSDVPTRSQGISFNNKEDGFILSNAGLQCKKLHVFQHN
ncbi:hypothetical protein ACJMK2_030319 [Sinanodonta woodiana]|uniref:TRIM56 n=1 Tax=Sinanodonta woodiana TaxID=1069815 RepID=A0ABD3XDB1_SINWO